MIGITNTRASGILLAVSSLSSPHGIGTFGEDARRWVDFLHAAGQSYWQILPLGPTGWGDSPYQSFSAFALSSYYIDLDYLAAQGLLTNTEISAVNWGASPDAVDYAALYASRENILRRAFRAFQTTAPAVFPAGAFDRFIEKNAAWLGDFALFMALKAEHGGRPWFEWEEPLRFREQTAIEAAKKRLQDDINFYMFVQFLAFSQWHDLKTYSRDKNVSIIGDMPIYVSLDSSDTWANHTLFQLDENRLPLRVAGCPPDPFAADGQLWGNPLYDWDTLKADGYGWWILRLKESLELFDVVRIDHFRGLESYFSIPAGDHDARGGEWIKGPGTAFIDALHAALPHARIIAEDLGYLTEDVAALLRHSGYPGMKVLQFAFDSREKSDYMPYAYPHNCVVYTGTHDNPTAKAWFETARREDIELATAYLGIDNIEKGPDMLIRCALSSVADLCVIPLQDYLGLGAEARMNAPSISGGNWRWRVDRNALTGDLSRRIHALTAIYGRTTH